MTNEHQIFHFATRVLILSNEVLNIDIASKVYCCMCFIYMVS